MCFTFSCLLLFQSLCLEAEKQMFLFVACRFRAAYIRSGNYGSYKHLKLSSLSEVSLWHQALTQLFDLYQVLQSRGVRHTARWPKPSHQRVQSGPRDEYTKYENIRNINCNFEIKVGKQFGGTKLLFIPMYKFDKSQEVTTFFIISVVWIVWWVSWGGSDWSGLMSPVEMDVKLNNL